MTPQTITGPDPLVQQTRTLTSLAMLKVDIDERHRNYIDYLITFVLDVLTNNPPEIITDAAIAELLEKHR